LAALDLAALDLTTNISSPTVDASERMAGLEAARRRRRVAWRWHVHVQA